MKIYWLDDVDLFYDTGSVRICMYKKQRQEVDNDGDAGGDWRFHYFIFLYLQYSKFQTAALFQTCFETVVPVSANATALWFLLLYE